MTMIIHVDINGEIKADDTGVNEIKHQMEQLVSVIGKHSPLPQIDISISEVDNG